jgi:homocysteine S-methyltransferase
MVHPFRERLSGPPLLADGGMGTLLYQNGVPFGRSFDELNLSSPDLVCSVHQEYLRAGAELIETNTFGANRVRLEGFGHDKKVREINLRGTKLAREAREIEGKVAFVAGSIGPLGKGIVPIGNLTAEQAYGYFVEQAEGLLEGGVDVIIIETMSSLTEMTTAIRAVRHITDVPVIASMSYTEELRTYLGRTPDMVVGQLNEMPVDVIGANCAVGPQVMLDIIQALAEKTTLPLSAMPNAGVPRMINGRFMYTSTPQYFASFVAGFVKRGVKILGGCCGTTPAHIRAIHDALGALSAPEQVKSGEGAQPDSVVRIKPVVTEDTAELKDTVPDKSEFAKKLGKTFMVSIELDPPRGSNPRKILQGARLFKEHGVDAVNVADSPMARVRMSAVAAAAMIRHNEGIEPIVHFTCRDRNLMGLQADLIGAHALGLRNVLAITGDPPTVGDFPGASGVYDVDSIGLVKILTRLNNGQDFAGSSIGAPTAFTIGVASNPSATDLNLELSRFQEKIRAGAHFSFTQPLYELEILERFLDRLGGRPIPIFLGLLPLMSFRHASFLHNEVPGISVPQTHRDAMEKAGNEGAKVGVELCRELLERARPLVDGVYLMPSFGRYETCLDVVKNLLAERKFAGQISR